MIHVRVLGAFEVEVDGAELDLRGSRRRALIAYLVLHAGEVVSIERICEEVWNGGPPRDAPGTVKTYVSQFRKLLSRHGLAEVVRTAPGGYVLEPDGVLLDGHQFERLASEASALSPEDRVKTLDRALELWRGEALAEFVGSDWAAPEANRLNALRRAARIERADALLATDPGDRAVAEL